MLNRIRALVGLARPEYTLEGFEEWVKTQDPRRPLNYWDPFKCPVKRYAVSMGDRRHWSDLVDISPALMQASRAAAQASFQGGFYGNLVDVLSSGRLITRRLQASSGKDET